MGYFLLFVVLILAYILYIQYIYTLLILNHCYTLFSPLYPSSSFQSYFKGNFNKLRLNMDLTYFMVGTDTLIASKI